MESDEILNHSYNTDTKFLRINSSREEGIETIDVSYQKIHEGLAYTFVCDKSSLDNGDSFWIMFKTNSVKNVHFRPALLFTTDSLVVGKLYESPTFTEGTGSSVNVYNHNRNIVDSDNSDVVIMLEPENLTEGTRLPLTVFAGVEGSRQSQSGGFRSSEEEWILKSDTLYGIKVENIGSSSTDVTVIPFWYEVEY